MMITDLSNPKNVKSKSICLCRTPQQMGLLLPVSIHKKQPITSSKFILLILACFGARDLMNRVFPTTLFPEKAPVWFRELRIYWLKVKSYKLEELFIYQKLLKLQQFLRVPKEYVDQVCLSFSFFFFIYFLSISLMLKKKMLTSTKK